MQTDLQPSDDRRHLLQFASLVCFDDLARFLFNKVARRRIAVDVNPITQHILCACGDPIGVLIVYTTHKTTVNDLDGAVGARHVGTVELCFMPKGWSSQKVGHPFDGIILRMYCAGATAAFKGAVITVAMVFPHWWAIITNGDGCVVKSDDTPNVTAETS